MPCEGHVDGGAQPAGQVLNAHVATTTTHPSIRLPCPLPRPWLCRCPMTVCFCVEALRELAMGQDQRTAACPDSARPPYSRARPSSSCLPRMHCAHVSSSFLASASTYSLASAQKPSSSEARPAAARRHQAQTPERGLPLVPPPRRPTLVYIFRPALSSPTRVSCSTFVLDSTSLVPSDLSLRARTRGTWRTAPG